MGNRRLYKIECFHKLGTLESERLKVTALNLFHPTTSPLSKESVFSLLRHSLLGERGRVRGQVAINLESWSIFRRPKLSIDELLFIKFVIIRVIRCQYEKDKICNRNSGLL